MNSLDRLTGGLGLQVLMTQLVRLLLDPNPKIVFFLNEVWGRRLLKFYDTGTFDIVNKN